MNATATRSSLTRMILPFSIILNIFLVAVIAGHMIRQHSGDQEAQPILARALANVQKNLPPEDAAAFTKVMRTNAPQFTKAALDLAHARGELEKQIAAEPFDTNATSEALDAWKNAWIAFLKNFKGSLLEALDRLSPEGRRKLVEARVQGLRDIPFPK